MGNFRRGALYEGQIKRSRLGRNHNYAPLQCQIRFLKRNHRQPRTVRHVDYPTEEGTMQRSLH